MDSNEILIPAVIASVIWLLMLYIIIRAATDAAKQTELLMKQNRLAEIQLRLMAELLKKDGMSEEGVKGVKDLIDLNKSYFSKNRDFFYTFEAP